MNRTPTFLMANLGSDTSQVFMYVEKGDFDMAKEAANRTERIIDELLTHPELSGRTEEVEIIRDVIKDALSENRQLEIKKEEIESYFMPFSIKTLSENNIT